jgi:hypothetical protein
MSGRLVERLAFRDGQVAIYQRMAAAEGYEIEWGPLDPVAATGAVPSPAELALAARLDRHGRAGRCAFDAVWQQLPGRGPELLVLLRSR